MLDVGFLPCHCSQIEGTYTETDPIVRIGRMSTPRYKTAAGWGGKLEIDLRQPYETWSRSGIENETRLRRWASAKE